MNEAKSRFESSEKKIERMDRKVDEGFLALEKKIGDLEVSTLWKIKEFERIVATRVNEEFVREFFKAERENLESDFADFFNKQLPRLEQRHLETDSRVDALQRNLDKASEKITAVDDEAAQRLSDAIEALRAQLEEQLKDSKSIDERVRQLIEESRLPGMNERFARLEAELLDLRAQRGGAPSAPSRRGFSESEALRLREANDQLSFQIKDLQKKLGAQGSRVQAVEEELERRGAQTALLSKAFEGDSAGDPNMQEYLQQQMALLS